jgi:hypothetical protein
VNRKAFFYFNASGKGTAYEIPIDKTTFLIVFFSCTKEKPQDEEVYQNRDYREVKLYLDTLNAKLQAQADSTGTYKTPYTDLVNGPKLLIFFGTSHPRDTAHPQFSQLALQRYEATNSL